MVWGMTLGTFTAVHVALSLIGIATGFVVMVGLLRGTQLRGWTALFLVTTVATSVTGYGFPVDRLLPSHVVGALSLVVLTLAIVALYGLHLRRVWRSVYVVCSALALYFNVFVGIVQAFLHIPTLHAPRAGAAAERAAFRHRAADRAGRLHSADDRGGEAVPQRGACARLRPNADPAEASR